MNKNTAVFFGEYKITYNLHEDLAPYHASISNLNLKKTISTSQMCSSVTALYNFQNGVPVLPDIYQDAIKLQVKIKQLSKSVLKNLVELC